MTSDTTPQISHEQLARHFDGWAEDLAQDRADYVQLCLRNIAQGLREHRVRIR